MKPKKKKKFLLTKIQKQNIKKISPRESLSTQLSRLLLHHYNGQYFILRYKVDVFSICSVLFLISTESASRCYCS